MNIVGPLYLIRNFFGGNIKKENAGPESNNVGPRSDNADAGNGSKNARAWKQ